MFIEYHLCPPYYSKCLEYWSELRTVPAFMRLTCCWGDRQWYVLWRKIKISGAWWRDAILDRKVEDDIFEETSFEKHPNEENEPFEYLGEELSICLKSKEVQRPWGRNILGVFKEQQGGPFGRSRLSEVESGRKWSRACGRLQSFFSEAFKGGVKERLGPGI